MTREEAIKKLEFLKINLPAAKDEISGIINLIETPWISIKDDLPCNHEELLLDNGLATKKVFVLINATTPTLVPMAKFSKWDWVVANVTHWFAIPELPKE